MAPTRGYYKGNFKNKKGNTVKASANIKLYYKQKKEDNAVVLGAASSKRFSNTFRLPRNVFMVILGKIQHDLQTSVVTEEPISPACRLGICL